MEQANILKFGLKWNNIFYLDKVIMTGWVDDRTPFNMASDATRLIKVNKRWTLFS